MVRQSSAKALCPSSNLGGASNQIGSFRMKIADFFVFKTERYVELDFILLKNLLFDDVFLNQRLFFAHCSFLLLRILIFLLKFDFNNVILPLDFVRRVPP